MELDQEIPLLNQLILLAVLIFSYCLDFTDCLDFTYCFRKVEKVQDGNGFHDQDDNDLRD